MVTVIKNNSQRARSVSTFLLTGLWKYFTQSAQYFHVLPQYIVKSSMKFEYKLYKLCGLIGVNNWSSKDNLVKPVKYQIDIIRQGLFL